MYQIQTQKRKQPALFMIIPLALSMITVSAVFLYQNYYHTVWQPATLTETREVLENPGRGWYQIYGYALSDDSIDTSESIRESYKHDTESKLAMLQINLKNYRTSPISNTALKQLELILSSWEQSGKQLILRFLYDWDGMAITSEPEEIDLIMNHMSQVASVVNRHAAAIYTLQGIFVGNHGEMHNSNHMSDASMHLLIEHLAEVTDPSIYLSVRTPAQWRSIVSSYEPLPAEQGFSNSLYSRIGLFNDGMLGSESDCGTYGNVSISKASGYSDKGTRSEELAFQNQLCRYVPNGGEVIIDNPYNDLSTAISDLYQMHISYLNSMHDPSVLDKWKTSIYQGTDIFNGSSGYEFIGNHLGYRYVLNSTGLIYHPFRNKNTALTIDINNIGFANSYKKYEVSVNLINTDTKQIQKISVSTDTRTWLSGKVTRLTVPLDIPYYHMGNYQLYLDVTDPFSTQQIQFANTGYDRSLGYYIGNLSIDKILPLMF